MGEERKRHDKINQGVDHKQSSDEVSHANLLQNRSTPVMDLESVRSYIREGLAVVRSKRSTNTWIKL